MAARTVRGVFVAVLAVAAMLLLLDVRGAGPADTLRGAVGALTGPPVRAFSWLRTEAGARFGGAADEQARIAQLEQELTEARAALGQRASGAEVTGAQELVAALPIAGYTLQPARVVARSAPQHLTGAVTISAGSGAGVTPGMVVIDSDAVVGVVDTVSPGVSTLRLTSDSDARLAGRVATSKETGILQGTGEDAAALTLLDPLGAMAVGDRVVTIRSADGTVPADLPLGQITSVVGSAADLSRTAQVDPGVKASTLDRLAVLVPQDRG